jgi:type IV secretory pathway VirB2 component (pilin)
MPLAALAQGSPFDTGFNAIQSLFTGTIAKVASLVAIVIGGYLVIAAGGHPKITEESLDDALVAFAMP